MSIGTNSPNDHATLPIPPTMPLDPCHTPYHFGGCFCGQSNWHFFFETERQKFYLNLLIKKKKIIQLINGKSGKNHKLTL
jgi:hypothetical protein